MWKNSWIIQDTAAPKEKGLKSPGKGYRRVLLNCTGGLKHLGKSAQVAELIFTTCPIHVSGGTDMCLLALPHSKE